MTDHLTISFIVGVVAIVTVFDVWTLARRGYTTTISWQLYIHGKRWPIVPFLFGLLAGHLYFPNRAGMDECPATPPPAEVAKP